MFKQWLKQFIALFICVIVILSPITTYADEYIEDDDDEDTNGATYYIVDGEDFGELFDFGLDDVDDIIDWIQNFNTYTVIKEFEEDGEVQYKMYFNTPNLQTIVKNKVVSNVSDGYTDSTYDVNDTEWIVDVGRPNDATSQNSINAITKYGFQIESPIYMGEYPKEVMSAAGVVPTSFWGSVWRAIKSVFGASFIKAPDSDNFNTITYLNHSYEDKNAYVIEFFQKYYLPYFEHKIAEDECSNGDSGYFNGPEDVIALTVTEDEYNNAKMYNLLHEDDYQIACKKYEVWDYIQTYKDTTVTLYNSHSYTQNGTYRVTFNEDGDLSCHDVFGTSSVNNYLCKNIEYLDHFSTYAATHKKQLFVLYSAYCLSNDIPLNDLNTWSIPSDSEELSKFAAMCNSSYDCIRSLHCDVEYTTTNENNETETIKETDISISHAIFSGNFNFITKIYVPGVSGTEYTDINSLLLFWGTGSYDSSSIEWEESEIVDDNSRVVYENYQRNKDTMNRYESFVEKMELGEESSSKTKQQEILYKQCMIPNDGEDGECYSKEYGEGKTTLTIANIYAYSGLYKITENYPEDATELKEADVYRIINKLQSYCGPYYSIVLSNMIKLMCCTAAYDGDDGPMYAMQKDDPRVMPYDISSMIESDAENYKCTDPRVDIYKDHIIGGLISDFTINWGFNIFIKPQKSIINIAGRITEISIFMQQLCNFETFDNWGLSPTTMWNNTYIGLLLSLLALYFIIKTMIAVIKMGDNKANLGRILVSFLIFFFELGFILAINSNPEGVWKTVQKTQENIMSLGERMTPSYNDGNLHYLFGDSEDIEVMYYLPYLDTWSRFNTGYGLSDPHQILNYNTDIAELKGYDKPVTIGASEINHYSILLADSFSYYGESQSINNAVFENGKNYNGNTINNNAYRVVDHFLAPRVNIEKNSNGNLELSVTENENYNGQFQGGKGSLLDLIVKLLNCCLMCLLSLIKFFTFLWQWFLLYIFIFKVILGKGPEGKTWSQILLETFSPTLCIIFIGMYSGILMTLGMELTGLIGLIVEICLFVLTFILIRWWKSLSNGLVFPVTLGWLYILTNMTQHRRNVMTQELNDDFRREMNRNGHQPAVDDEGKEINTNTLEGKYKLLFDNNGRYQQGKDIYGKDKKLYEAFYKQYVARQRDGKKITDEQRIAFNTMKNDEHFTYLNNTSNNKLKKRYNKLIKNTTVEKDKNSTTTTTKTESKGGDVNE